MRFLDFWISWFQSWFQYSYSSTYALTYNGSDHPPKSGLPICLWGDHLVEINIDQSLIDIDHHRIMMALSPARTLVVYHKPIPVVVSPMEAKTPWRRTGLLIRVLSRHCQMSKCSDPDMS